MINKKCVICGVCALLVSLSASLVRSHQPEGQNAEVAPSFALLIGVGKYPNLSPAERLDGTSNDIKIVKDLLLGRFKFPEENVKTLLDEEATGEAIRQAIDDLAKRVKALPDDGPKAQVYFHFSGHGSQVPDQAVGHPDRDEDDGLDETLVPYDATKQGGDEDIRDDDINKLINQICGEEKARIFLVYDCCHSGTGARGNTRTRQLPRNVKPTPVPDDAPPIARKKLPPGVVFLSACQAREVEPEFKDKDETYGLLTRFLVGTLSEEKIVSGISYDLLQKAIVSRYKRDRVMQAPHPQIEASDVATLRSSILGAGPEIDDPTYYAAKAASKETVEIQAGKFHHITVGSLFELFEKPEDIATSSTEDGEESSKSVAWLRVTDVEGVTSKAQVIEWEDEDKTKYRDAALPSNVKAELAVLRYQERSSSGIRLKVVHVQPDGQDGPPLGSDSELVPKVVVDALTGIKKEGEADWMTWITDQDEPCDMVLRMDGEYASLFPASGTAEVVAGPSVNPDIPESLRGGWGPIDLRTGKVVPADEDTEEPEDTLSDILRRITRAQNLVSLAESGDDSTAENYQIQFELIKVIELDDSDPYNPRITNSEVWQPEAEITSHKDSVIPPSAGTFWMRGGPDDETPGDYYALRVTNSQQEGKGKPVYVTVLEISPNMGVTVLMPEADEEPIKLEPGESKLCPPYECYPPFGVWRSVVLATHEPYDFKFVAQPDLQTVRGESPTGGSASLQSRLHEEMYFTPPTTRGRKVARKKGSDTSWHSQLLTYQAVPADYGNAIKTRGLPSLASIKTELATDTVDSSAVSADDEGFQVVKVFYGTDRKAIHAGEPQKLTLLNLPIYLFAAAGGTAILMLLTCFRPRKILWGSLAIAGLAATIWLGVSELVGRTRQAQSLARTGVAYGTERGDLEVGICEISIPDDHETGELEAPSIWRLEVREDPTKHLMIKDIIPKGANVFYEELHSVVQASSRKEVFLFVHGYNTSFEQAARRTGQMTYDLKFEGAPIFYSWPSQNDVLHYTVDEANVENSVPYLKQFLLDVTHRSGAQSVNLIAHSMGNRALTKALQELSLELGEEKRLFNQVILAAPDVDAGVFKKQIAPAITKTANQVTLYASSNDRALIASKEVHGHPRAGESGENIVVAEGIDTIDVSSLETDMLGHSYYGDNNSVVADIFVLLHEAEPWDKRPWLRPTLLRDLRYWIFQGEESDAVDDNTSPATGDS